MKTSFFQTFLGGQMCRVFSLSILCLICSIDVVFILISFVCLLLRYMSCVLGFSCTCFFYQWSLLLIQKKKNYKWTWTYIFVQLNISKTVQNLALQRSHQQENYTKHIDYNVRSCKLTQANGLRQSIDMNSHLLCFDHTAGQSECMPFWKMNRWAN